jgi:ABC-type lipoprotein export system ATPase subunit
MRIDSKFFVSHNLENPDNVHFSNSNIIIGKNGAGKTRFLNAVIDNYKKEGYKPHQIVFADFPHLTYEEKASENESESDDYNNLIDFFSHNTQVSLEKFIMSVNAHENRFINDLFSYKPTLANDKTRWNNMMRKLNHFLNDILGFSFDEREASMLVKGSKHNSESFKKYISQQASPGERNLFYISIFLASFVAYRKEENLIILLDEPELHLHSDQVTKFIDLISNELSNATLWIATHSIHLLPKFSFEQIVFIIADENGKGIIQKRNSSMYADIFNMIVGKSDDLEMFLRDINSWEACQFSIECFTNPPKSVILKTNDPQITKFMEGIRKKRKNVETLKILDYGAGQGRFGAALHENIDLQDKIQCYALDIESDEYPWKNNKPGYYGLFTDKDPLPKYHFDYVLLVNTLHEIHPASWEEIFIRIHNCLKPNGALFFCEALTLRQGEYLGKDFGYLVLGQKALEVLFNVEAQIFDKIEVAIISRKQLTNFTKQSDKKANIITALKILADESLHRYWEIITSQKDNTDNSSVSIAEKSGRKLAFYAAQNINAHRGIKLLECLPSIDITNRGVELLEALPNIDITNRGLELLEAPSSIDITKESLKEYLEQKFRTLRKSRYYNGEEVIETLRKYGITNLKALDNIITVKFIINYDKYDYLVPTIDKLVKNILIAYDHVRYFEKCHDKNIDYISHDSYTFLKEIINIEAICTKYSVKVK